MNDGHVTAEVGETAEQQPQEDRAKMRPIWYWVGWLLLINGLIVCAAGIWDAWHPPAKQVVFHELHVGIWWGAFVGAFGWCMMWLNKDKRVD